MVSRFLVSAGRGWGPNVVMMIRSSARKVVTALGLSVFLAGQSAVAEETRPAPIVISGRTVIAFFMPGRSKELSSAARADFERYAAKAAPALKESGIEFHQLYPKRVIEIQVQDRVQLLKPRFGAGYYFVTPEGKTRVEYGIKTDIHLLQYTRQYLPREASPRPHE
jgi:hypothetical protein